MDIVLSTNSKIKSVELNHNTQMSIEGEVLDLHVSLGIWGMSKLDLKDIDLVSLSIKSDGMIKTEGDGRVKDLFINNNGMGKIFCHDNPQHFQTIQSDFGRIIKE